MALFFYRGWQKKSWQIAHDPSFGGTNSAGNLQVVDLPPTLGVVEIKFTPSGLPRKWATQGAGYCGEIPLAAWVVDLPFAKRSFFTIAIEAGVMAITLFSIPPCTVDLTAVLSISLCFRMMLPREGRHATKSLLCDVNCLCCNHPQWLRDVREVNLPL